MNTLAFAATIGAASALSAIELKYMNHLAEFGKNMSSIEEFNTRLVYFSVLDQYIEETNSDDHTYTLGHNQFSDWSRAEYVGMLGYMGVTQEDRSYAISMSPRSVIQLTGSPKVKSPTSRTRAHAAPAGLSQPLVLLRALTLS